LAVAATRQSFMFGSSNDGQTVVGWIQLLSLELANQRGEKLKPSCNCRFCPKPNQNRLKTKNLKL